MPDRSSHLFGQLTSNEYSVLRSYAIGMGEKEILKLTGLSEFQFAKMRQMLFEKFQVCNVHFLIVKAKQYGYLDAENFMNEAIKTRVLDFIVSNEFDLNQGKSLSKKEQWKWYRLLLSFLSSIEQITSMPEKKIPPKRDKDF